MATKSRELLDWVAENKDALASRVAETQAVVARHRDADAVARGMPDTQRR